VQTTITTIVEDTGRLVVMVVHTKHVFRKKICEVNIMTPAITLMAFCYSVYKDSGFTKSQINKIMRGMAKEHGYKWENIKLLVKARAQDVGELLQAVTPLFDANGKPVAGLVDMDRFNQYKHVAQEMNEAGSWLSARR